jgi:hypothetical protein
MKIQEHRENMRELISVRETRGLGMRESVKDVLTRQYRKRQKKLSSLLILI